MRWWAIVMAIPLLVGSGVAIGYLLERTVGSVQTPSGLPLQVSALELGSPHIPQPSELSRDPAMEAGAAFMARVTEYKDRLEKNPSDVEAMVFLGNANYDITRFEKASEYYQQVLELDPTNIHVRTDLATSYFNLGNTKNALAEIRKVLGLSPAHETALFNLGVILLQAEGDKAGAIEAWERLIREHPDSPRAQTIRQQIDILKNSG